MSHLNKKKENENGLQMKTSSWLPEAIWLMGLGITEIETQGS